MSVVDQAISAKAIEPEADDIARALNREVVPVVKRLRAAVNERLNAAAVPFGDGVSTVATVEHPFNTLDVFVTVVDLATGQDMLPPDAVAVRDSASEVIVTYLVAPPADGTRILVRT